MFHHPAWSSHHAGDERAPNHPILLAAAAIAPLTPRSLTDRAARAAEIVRCGAQGYALVDEELELGVRSIAVPVRDRAGRVAAAVNISVSVGSIP